MPDPGEFDPEKIGGIHWVRITLTFDQILSWIKKLFGKENGNEKD